MSILSAMSGTFATARSVGMFDPPLRGMGYIANLIYPNSLPGVLEIYDAWRAGEVEAGLARGVLRSNGVNLPERSMRNDRERSQVGGITDVWQRSWAAVLDQRYGRASMGELLAMRNQRLITENEFRTRAQQQGFWRQDVVNELVRLSENMLPNPGDLVSFALREAWDQTTVNRFQYDAEFPPEFQYWMARMGFNGDARVQEDGVPRGEMVRWPQIFWRVHWRPLSPTQAYEMYQRLRPDRVNRYLRELPGLRAFTLDDLKTTLKVNDFPVPFREQLAAIAYHRPRLVDIDRFYTSGAIDRREAIALHLDLGYAPPDAETRVAWLDRERYSRPRDPVVKAASRDIVAFYREGLLTFQEGLDQLIRLYSGNRFNLEQLGTHQGEDLREFVAMHRYAGQQLRVVESQQTMQRAKALKKAWRRQFLRGVVTETQLRDDMAAQGFKTRFIDDFVAALKVELASGRLLLSTAQIKRYVVKGILPLETARLYLRNLGWKDPEIKYIILDIQRDLDMEAAKMKERMAKDQAARQKALEKQAQLAKKQAAEALRNLNRQASPAELKRYYVRFIIKDDDFLKELERRGYDKASREQHLIDARIERKNYLERRRQRNVYDPVAAGQWQAAQDPAPETPTQSPAP